MIVKSAGFTVTATVVEWDFVPPLDEMMTWYAPIGVPCKAVTLKVVLAFEPGEGVRILSISVVMIHPVPVDETLVLRPVARSKPLTLPIVIVVVAVDPWFTLRLDGEAASEKSLWDCKASESAGRAIVATAKEPAVTMTASKMDQRGAFFLRKDAAYPFD